MAKFWFSMDSLRNFLVNYKIDSYSIAFSFGFQSNIIIHIISDNPMRL